MSGFRGVGDITNEARMDAEARADANGAEAMAWRDRAERAEAALAECAASLAVASDAVAALDQRVTSLRAMLMATGMGEADIDARAARLDHYARTLGGAA